MVFFCHVLGGYALACLKYSGISTQSDRELAEDRKFSSWTDSSCINAADQRKHHDDDDTTFFSTFHDNTDPFPLSAFGKGPRCTSGWMGVHVIPTGGLLCTWYKMMSVHPSSNEVALCLIPWQTHHFDLMDIHHADICMEQ